MADSVYFDYAAATPLDPRVLVAMEPFFTTRFYNPSASYAAAREAHNALESARRAVAHWLGSRSSEVIFTAGGTEANNLAVHGVLRQFPDGNIVVSGIEHESVLMPAQRYDCREVAVGPDGLINLTDLRRKIDKNTVLVSVMYANNEIGTIQPIPEIAKIIADKRAARTIQRASSPATKPLYFHSDACQAANYLDIHVNRLGVDLLTLNGGKIYGPKQSAVLYVKSTTRLQPLIDGGGQERGLRSGTENMASAVGLSVALDLSQRSRHKAARDMRSLQQLFLTQLTEHLPSAVINGSKTQRLPNNIHLTLPGQDNERLLIQLDEAGIQAAAGSACSASNEVPSHVLRTIGLDDAAAQASLRFSMGRSTTRADVERVVSVLVKLASV